MKTKNKYLFLITAFMILAFSSATFAAEAPVLKATLQKYEPVPAQPGGFLTVYVQVENIGAGRAERARIELIDSFPFSAASDTERAKTIGILNPGSAYVAEFRITVADDAVEGTNELKFKITDDYTSNVFTERIFSVNVQTQDANIDVDKIVVTPSDMQPGDTAKVDITLLNTADSSLTDVSTKLVLYTVTGTTVTDLPFAISDSVSKKYIPLLKSGESRIIEYNIISYPTISPGIYKVPLTIEFFDGTGQNYTQNEFVTIVVNPEVNIYMSIESSEITKNTMSGDVVIRVVNKGFGNLKFANIELEKSPDFTVLNPYSQVYIGNIDSDDYETAEFSIKANKGKITLPVKLTYRDSLNNEYTTTQALELDIGNATGASQKRSVWPIVLIVVVIIAVGVYIYLKRKNKKK